MYLLILISQSLLCAVDDDATAQVWFTSYKITEVNTVGRPSLLLTIKSQTFIMFFMSRGINIFVVSCIFYILKHILD